METNMREPKTYQEWIICFDTLSKKSVTVEEIENLKNGVCPGIESVYTQFFERVQDTVNAMIKRVTKNCTRRVNECLEEGDFSNIEVLLIRSYRELLNCRFYIYIPFIEKSDARLLDKATISEVGRYWQTMKKFFEELLDETNSADIYDMVYFINRLVTKEKANYGKL